MCSKNIPKCCKKTSAKGPGNTTASSASHHLALKKKRIKCNVNHASPRCSRKLNEKIYPHMCLRNGGTFLLNFLQELRIATFSLQLTASRTLEPMRCLSLPVFKDSKKQPKGHIIRTIQFDMIYIYMSSMSYIQAYMEAFHLGGNLNACL